jgi:hypothetical protein
MTKSLPGIKLDSGIIYKYDYILVQAPIAQLRFHSGSE